jgi:GMP synthase (glutamine-hydrolysing)
VTSAPSGDAERDRILILDFGSQYTQLIARRVREHSVYCEIHPPTLSLDEIRAWNPAGIILSGGPSSVLDEDSPTVDPAIVDLGRPVLGICYGLQLLAHRLGGVVEKADDREYGRALFKLDRDDPLFANLPGGAERVVWMSHGDRVLRLPDGFTVLGTSEGSPFAAVRHAERPIWGVQFHPEVVHTEAGRQILANFAHDICGCSGSWTMQAFIDEAIERCASRWAIAASSAGSRAASIRRWRRCSSTARSATSSPACSSTTASCERASAKRWSACSASTSRSPS